MTKNFEKEKKEKKKLEKICLFIIKWGTYLALLTPLIISAKFFFPFVALKSLYFMGLVEIIFFTWLILIFYFPQYRPRKNLLLISLILFLIILTLSSFLGADFFNSFWSKPERMTGLLMLFHLLAFFLVVSSVFNKKSDWIKIFLISISIGVILSLITFFSKNPIMKDSATLGNSSFLGTSLLFNLFLALYLILTVQKGIKKIYSLICFLIIFWGLFLSEARAAKISFLIGLVLLFFLYLIFIPKKRYLNLLGLILLNICLISFLIISFLLFQEGSIVQEKFIEKVTKARLIVWEKAWKGFLERPLLGWGPENFDFVFAKYFHPCMSLPECGGEIWFDRAHNIIFDTLVNSGILGLLSYFGIFFSVFYLLWKNYFKNNIEFWTTGVFSILLFAYFLQNLTVFDMVSSYLMFFLILGFVVSINNFKEESPQSSSRPIRSWFISLIAILFIFSFFYFIIQPLRLNYYVITAIKTEPGSKERLDLYKKALTTSPLGKYQIREFFAQNTLEFAYSEKIRNVSIENFKKEIEFGIEELEKSRRESPWDFRSHLKLGQIYNIYSVFIDPTKFSETEKILERTIKISPTNQQGYWALAQTRLYQGKFEEALSLAEKAISLEPKVFQSHRIAVQIAKMMKDDELVQKKIQEAIKIDPQWETELQKI